MTILNTIDICCSWCKWNFGPFYHWKDRCEEIIFLLFLQISWNNWQELTWATLLDNDLDLLLYFKQIRLDLVGLRTTLVGFVKCLHCLILNIGVAYDINKKCTFYRKSSIWKPDTLCRLECDLLLLQATLAFGFSHNKHSLTWGNWTC